MSSTCVALDCPNPARAHSLCTGHLAQLNRGESMSPLRTRTPGRVPLTIRVRPAVKARAASDMEGARKALDKWASK
jgi:hypothetical protein